jgi:hypothetical protein
MIPMLQRYAFPGTGTQDFASIGQEEMYGSLPSRFGGGALLQHYLGNRFGQSAYQQPMMSTPNPGEQMQPPQMSVGSPPNYMTMPPQRYGSYGMY